MCSIFGTFDLQPGDDLAALRRQALELSQRQRHRGPDWSGVFVDAGVILVHERLAIVDPASGAQPLRSRDGGLALAVNGEIYNHRELRAASAYEFTTASDCEVINALYRESDAAAPAADLCNKLNGIFAFALWDGAAQRYLIARDPIGVCPLYWGHDAQVGLHLRGFGDEGAGRSVHRCGTVPAWPCLRQRRWRIASLLPQAMARL